MSPSSGAVLRGAGGPTVQPRALLLLTLLGLSAIGANPVPSDVIVPPVNSDRRGLPARSTDRPVVIVSTIDGGIHALEVKTGVLRWTVPSGDPVVNFQKPDEGKYERKGRDGAHPPQRAGGKEDGSSVNGESGATSESTDVAPIFSSSPWEKETLGPRSDDFEGFIPIYSGIPGGGFLHKPEGGQWQVFERTAEDLVSQSPWYDKASRGIIVGAKATKVYALDPENGNLSWEEEDVNGRARCEQSRTDTLIITRSMYSIKVRNAETGAFFWNVSISEFHAHATDTQALPGEPILETPLLVTSAEGDEVQCFDRSSGNLQWTHKLPAAAVSAHLWERKRAAEIELHSQDQAELVVASDSKALDVARAVGTVHVHRHDGGMFARLHPPLRVPTHVARNMAGTTAKSSALQASRETQLSTHFEGLASVTDKEVLVKREPNAIPCKPDMPGYPECLIGTYDISFSNHEVPVVPAQEAGGERVLGGGVGRVWDAEFLDILDHQTNRHVMKLLLQLASQSPVLFLGLATFILLMGWMLGRSGSKGGDAVERRISLASVGSSNSIPDLASGLHMLTNGTADEQCSIEDKDSGSLSTATTGEPGMMMLARDTSLDASSESWSEKWHEKSSENALGNTWLSNTSDEAENADQFPMVPVKEISKSSGSRFNEVSSSKASGASTAKGVARVTQKGAAQKGQSRGKHKAALHIPDPFQYGAPDMKALTAMLDDNFSRTRYRRNATAMLSRENSEDPDDESWAGERRQLRSISLGSHLSTASKDDFKSDADAALAACNFTASSSAPNSPKTMPAACFVHSPGFPGPAQWNTESRYQKDFEELGKIGKGAFGSVFRVKQRLDEREYAVKKVRLEKDLNSSDNQRIMREVKSFSILSDHPKIVRYYGTWKEVEIPVNDGQNSTIEGSVSESTWDQSSMFGDESEASTARCLEPVNWLYIQMELCTTSLRQLLNATGKDVWLVDGERIHEIRRYLHDVSEGLSYIHSKHYIHRDMKPDNIFIVDQQGVLVAKLGDFGLSCKTSPDKAADGNVGEMLTPLSRDMSSSGDRNLLSFSGSEENMDAASLAELTRACGTRMYFSPELEHSGVYNQLVDVYALGIVVFEMLHVFKTGMERIKLIEQLKNAMCTPPAMEFSKVPLKDVLVHWGAPVVENGKRLRSPPTGSKPNTPTSEKAAAAKTRRRAFEQTGTDSGGDSGYDSPSALNPLAQASGSKQGSAGPSSPDVRDKEGLYLVCNLEAGAPWSTSPRAPAGEEGRTKPHSERLCALVKAMNLPSEVLDLYKRFEFEVCLLLRLLSQKPEQRPSAIEMREALYQLMLDADRSPQHAVADKADNQEVQKLRQEVAELKKIAAHAGRGSGTAFTAAGQQANRGEISSGGGLQSPGVRSQRPGSLLVPQTQTSLIDQKSPTSPTAQARGPFKSQRSHSELNLSSLSKDAVQPPFLR